jgi:hypothetical protein
MVSVFFPLWTSDRLLHGCSAGDPSHLGLVGPWESIERILASPKWINLLLKKN